jgi:hypothetical protein
MERTIYSRILLISLIFMIISMAGIIISVIFQFEPGMVLGTWLFTIPMAGIIASYSIVHVEKGWIRTAAKLSLFSSPLYCMGLVFLINGTERQTIILFFAIILLSLLIILGLVHIFIFSDAVSLRSTILLLALAALGIIFKRFSLPFSNLIILFSLIFLLLGFFIYGIRCLFLAGKNLYLKYIVLAGSWIIAVSFSGLMFKILHWPAANEFVTAANISMVMLTLFVLLTLPNSGYIEWEVLHKRILRRILLPWMFIFLLFIMRFLFPSLNNIVWGTNENRTPNSFGMSDYSIENKNGLKLP